MSFVTYKDSIFALKTNNMGHKTTNTGRATFATRLGAVAAAVGSAVGFGNIWRFPYITGQDGGGAFLIIYVLAVLFLGIPLMIAEFSIGRTAHRNVVGAYRKIAPGTPWWTVGALGLTVAMLILGFYVVISGWTLCYTWRALTNDFSATVSAMQMADASLDAAGALTADFGNFVSSPIAPLAWTILAIIINAGILLGGVQKGIERASSVLMPVLGILLLILVGNSFRLNGFAEGMRFLFVPDFSKVNGHVLIDAIGQAFFSLSVAMGIMVAYGSYLDDSTKLGKTASQVAIMDTLIAILAGVVIFPACFSFGIAPGQGSGLVFVTLPAVFLQMPGGYIIGVLFFFLITLAGITSCMSIFEVPISFLQEELNMSRKGAVAASCMFALVLGIACSLSLGLWNGFQIAGDCLFDFLDHVTSLYMMPICALLTAIMVGWALKKNFLEHAISNGGKDSAWFVTPLVWILRIFAPVAILVIFLSGIGLI